jgi:5-oxoprolinase (ATP-hydrolysing) subunit C
MRGTKWVLDGLRIVSAFGDRRLVGPSVRRRSFGVPPGGPFDRLSAALANAMLGLREESPVLEITLGPLVLEATEQTAVAAVGGPDGAFELGQGERLEVRPIGARAYVACAKGVSSRLLADPPRFDGAPLRVVRGPQANELDFDRFVGQIYRVGLASNRVGVRLEGEALSHGLSLPSEPAIPGAIQIPPNGQPIILGPDGPTIGGYPKVAVVIDADLDNVGRLKPGDTVRFRGVSLEGARAARAECEAYRALRCAELRLFS